MRVRLVVVAVVVDLGGIDADQAQIGAIGQANGVAVVDEIDAGTAIDAISGAGGAAGMGHAGERQREPRGGETGAQPWCASL